LILGTEIAVLSNIRSGLVISRWRNGISKRHSTLRNL
jgi:hypothetical protein